MNEFDAPTWSSSVTAPTTISTIANFGIDPCWRIEPPRTTITPSPATMSPTPSTPSPDSPSATSSEAAAVATRTIAAHVRLPPSYAQRAK